MVLVSAIPLAGPAFSTQEYTRRHDAVLARLDGHGLDAIAVTANSHLEYLTGYDGSGDYFAPFPLVMAPERGPTFVVREYDADAVRAQSCIADIVTFSQESQQVSVWADVLRRFGLDHARLGLELGAWNLAPRDVIALQTALPDLEVVDATRLVSDVAAVKSDVELDVMRRAMGLTRLAIETFHAQIVDGNSEADAASEIDAAVAAAGGETRDYTLLFGPRTALPHGSPGRFRLEQDQPAFIEVSGWTNGYAAGLCRSAVLGRHPQAEALHTLAEDALQASIEAIHPGGTAGEVDAACRRVLEQAGRTGTFRHRAGYQIGIMWTDRGNLSLEPGSDDVLLENMTLHMPIILFEQGRFGVGVSETVIVTNHGAEILSGLSRRIFRA